jgi:hypothetical protein
MKSIRNFYPRTRRFAIIPLSLKNLFILQPIPHHRRNLAGTKFIVNIREIRPSFRKRLRQNNIPILRYNQIKIILKNPSWFTEPLSGIVP